MLLCYREEHNMKMIYRLTFDTGWHRLDAWLQKVLCDVLRAPTKYPSCEHSSKQIAFAVSQVFITKFGPPHTNKNIPEIVKKGIVKKKFG